MHSAVPRDGTARSIRRTVPPMQQINLYLTELLEKMRTAMGARGTAVQIWNHYWIRLSSGGVLQVLKDGFEEMGKMQISTGHQTIFFSKLLTSPGYEKQGIGALVVTLGILYGVIDGATYLRLGETDTNVQKGGHFWTSLGLSEGYSSVQGTLRNMLRVQVATAHKLGVTIDPNAILVAANPVKLVTATVSRRKMSQ
jgi:hypothetical protein